MTASRQWAYDVVRAFVIEEQKLLSAPDGIVICELPGDGLRRPMGGGWRIQFGSGIAGRAHAAAVVRIAVDPRFPSDPKILGPYVTTKAGLVAQLKVCPGVVCRTCRGWSNTYDFGRTCRTCKRAGVYGRPLPAGQSW